MTCGVIEGKEEHAGPGGIFGGDVDLAEVAQHGRTLFEGVVVLVEHRKGRIEVYMCVEGVVCVCMCVCVCVDEVEEEAEEYIS